mgnify:CR=1 FL=1|jgi:hypothetical protein|tara:strand:+ start:425 stop:676 length:252 start_codon:yes stop_codon:yes gene_type:complete
MTEEIIRDKVQDSNYKNFFAEIERIRALDNIDYMDAILSYCEKKGIDVEVAAKFINTNLAMKSKIRIEAEELNYLEQTARLPI